MIESFFQSLERNRVAYLLISGQAAVLYGAAAFSEDIDLWIRPTQPNADALLDALREVGARYYKLTPPLTERNLRRGHGFHFRVPDDPDIFLDVMGAPPRVSDFEASREASRIMETSWGRIPVVGIRDLVALKSTQRLGDYPVIGQLVLRYIEERGVPDEQDLRWALDHVFTVEDLDELLAALPLAPWPVADGPLAACVAARDPSLRPAGVAAAIESMLEERLRVARRADRVHWADIIGELREFRAADRLLPEGQPV